MVCLTAAYFLISSIWTKKVAGMFAIQFLTNVLHSIMLNVQLEDVILTYCQFVTSQLQYSLLHVQFSDSQSHASMSLSVWLAPHLKMTFICLTCFASENCIVISTTVLENVCGFPFISYLIFHINILLYMLRRLWLDGCFKIVAFGSDSLKARCAPFFMSCS